MNPTTLRLLQGVDKTVAEARSLGGEGAAARLATTGALLRLLNHGVDGEFHSAHYARGRQLADTGLALLARNAATEFTDAMECLAPAVSADWNANLLEEHHDRLTAVLTRLVARMLVAGVNGAETAEFVKQAGAWENDFFTHWSAEVPPVGGNGQTPKLDRQTIQTYLHRRFPDAAAIEVLSTKALSGGYSRGTVLVELSAPLFGVREFVVRAELPASILTLRGIDITTEFHIIKLAFEAGIPAPEPFFLEAGNNETGVRFIAVRRAAGKNYGTAYGATEAISDRLTRNLVSGLAAIHKVDLDEHATLVSASHLNEWIADKTTTQSVQRWIETWQSFAQSLGTESPQLTHGFHWLRRNVPEVKARPVLLHSDYGLGNLLIDDERVTAVLDWEATHLGDPAEEVAWLIYNLRGQVEESIILRLYAEAGGSPVDQRRLRYFDVFTAVKLLVCGFAALSRYRNSTSADPVYCLLSTYTIEPYGKLISQFIARAESMYT